jgi:hypothetical protein
MVSPRTLPQQKPIPGHNNFTTAIDSLILTWFRWKQGAMGIAFSVASVNSSPASSIKTTPETLTCVED